MQLARANNLTQPAQPVFQRFEEFRARLHRLNIRVAGEASDIDQVAEQKLDRPDVIRSKIAGQSQSKSTIPQPAQDLMSTGHAFDRCELQVQTEAPFWA